MVEADNNRSDGGAPRPLRARLLSPARTGLNFDPRLFDEVEKSRKRLEALGPVVEGLPGVAAFQVPFGSGRDAKYGSLNDDATSTFSSPLLRIETRLPADWPGDFRIAPGIDIAKSVLWIFDTCISISEIHVEIAFEALPAEWDAAALEDHLSLLCATIYRATQAPVIGAIRCQLAADGRSASFPLVKAAPFTIGGADTILWTNRTYVVPPDAASPAVKRLTRCDYIAECGIRASGHARVHAGTNLVSNPSDLDDVMRGLLLGQYLYSLLETVFDEQIHMSREARSAAGSRTFTTLSSRTDAIADLASLIEIETLRLRSSLQSTRRRIFDAAYECYGYSDLIKSIAMRASVLDRQMDRLFRGRQLIYSRITRYVLLLLTSLQFISTTSDIYGIAQDFKIPISSGSFGILSITKIIGFNGTVNLMVLFVMLFAAFSVLKGDSGDTRQ